MMATPPPSYPADQWVKNGATPRVLENEPIVPLFNRFQPLQMDAEVDSNPALHQLGDGRVGCGPKQMHKPTTRHTAPSLPHDIVSKNKPQQNAMRDLDSVECMKNIANAQAPMAESLANRHQSGEKNVSVAQNPNNRNTSPKYSTQIQQSDALPVFHTPQLSKHEHQEIASTVEDTEIIPLYVWQNRHNSTDRQTCIPQNGNEFGYIPVNNLHTYNGPEVHWHIVPDILQAHQITRPLPQHLSPAWNQ